MSTTPENRAPDDQPNEMQRATELVRRPSRRPAAHDDEHLHGTRLSAGDRDQRRNERSRG
ncbi:MAG TPA: hypothetical protein VLF18_11215 [Tahibacter sp.]|uniref:hypothetical protein n=1 Tax=Tahibacter sp. TaxID=2056211 RepID=UPI002B9A0649|nr:hypothetical protein [Tahibacter sp.]HSX60758.1 hypothetical protein [Tahibacter sp.]